MPAGTAPGVDANAGPEASLEALPESVLVLLETLCQAGLKIPRSWSVVATYSSEKDLKQIQNWTEVDPNAGIRTQESKRRNQNTGIQTKESKPRKPKQRI